MKTFIIACVAAAFLAIGCVAGVTYLTGNYYYRWNSACAAANGVKLENTSGASVCVKGPVQIVTIAAKPW